MTELRRLESLRRDFVANASHELRTPIAAVRSATETLRSGALDDPAAAIRFLDIIERNAQRLQSLVEDMLELSKLESNEFKLKRERVELGSVVPIVLALFRERAEKKGVRLAAELARGPPSRSRAIARALEHVLSNLVDNAVKYCPSGTRIVVSAAGRRARVRLVVSDTGPGIPPEHLPRVFERFYRVDAGRSRELGGTGLGLSIVKHMVEAMRGKVVGRERRRARARRSPCRSSAWPASLRRSAPIRRERSRTSRNFTRRTPYVTGARDSCSREPRAPRGRADGRVPRAVLHHDAACSRAAWSTRRERDAGRRVDRAPRVTHLQAARGQRRRSRGQPRVVRSHRLPVVRAPLRRRLDTTDPAFAVARRFLAPHPQARRARRRHRPRRRHSTPRSRSSSGLERVGHGRGVRHLGLQRPRAAGVPAGRSSPSSPTRASAWSRASSPAPASAPSGAALENLQICAPTRRPGSSAMDAVSSRPLTVGKSMAIRRRDLAAPRRLPPGRRRARRGLRPRPPLPRRRLEDAHVASMLVENRNVGCSVSRTLERHTRWAKMRRSLNPAAFVAEPIMTPIVVASGASWRPVQGDGGAPRAVCLRRADGLCAARGSALRGRALAWRYAPLEIVRSYVTLLCWARACVSRRIEWRGHPFISASGHA